MSEWGRTFGKKKRGALGKKTLGKAAEPWPSESTRNFRDVREWGNSEA